MSLTAVNPETLPRPRGYSHAIEAEGGRLLFLAGQVAFDRDGKLVGQGDLVAQFRQVVANLRAVLESRGGALRDLVKLTIYVLDRSAYRAQSRAIGEVYRAAFDRHYPAMTLVEVRGLYDEEEGALLEIEGVAVLDRPAQRG